MIDDVEVIKNRIEELENELNGYNNLLIGAMIEILNRQLKLIKEYEVQNCGK